jgi:hypothetical protein
MRKITTKAIGICWNNSNASPRYQNSRGKNQPKNVRRYWGWVLLTWCDVTRTLFNTLKGISSGLAVDSSNPF